MGRPSSSPGKVGPFIVHCLDRSCVRVQIDGGTALRGSMTC